MNEYYKISLKKAEEEFKKGSLLNAKRHCITSIKALETVEALELLAEIELQLENYIEAEKWSQKALQLDSKNENALKLHAIALFFEKRFGEAKTEFWKLDKTKNMCC